MTAEIAILNTYGVSLAADSAVTLTIGGSEKKIYNSANKLFTLSKYHPVGIMIYSNAQFMDIEWEVLIKEYRKKLREKSFPTLFEYAYDFLNFLKETTYITESQRDKYLLRLFINSLNTIKNTFISDASKQIKEKGKITDDEAITLLGSTLVKIIKIQDSMKDNETFVLSSHYIDSKQKLVEKAIEIFFESFKVPDALKEDLKKAMLQDIQKSNSLPGYSGIVIAGYGENEIFPSIFYANVYGVVDQCLIRIKEEKNTINFDNKAIIVPFAQTEMVNSFMEGIDPVFENTIEKEIDVLFDGINKIIKDDFVSKGIELKKTFKKAINDFKRKVYVDPILNIVESLQKSDLAEMSEALVNLTSFKRHVSTEAETVGGPTDVAVITKGDGFIWIKRKHYFDPNLNRHFFENYFREGCKDE